MKRDAAQLAEWLDYLRESDADVDERGYVRLYHHTTCRAAEWIGRSGMLLSKEDGVFFSTRMAGEGAAYGPCVVEVLVDAALLELDDEFQDGELHVRVPLKRAGIPWREFELVDVHDPAENPASPSPSATRKYREFHQRTPKRVGAFRARFAIPDKICRVGAAKHVLYRSDKLNPETGKDEGVIDYIHDHGRGVHVYRADCKDGELVDVPARVRDATDLVLLGSCMGFAYVDGDGHTIEAKTKRPLPELYTIPSGRALLVVEGKRRVVAMMWGGKLGVERRGIVG